MNNLESPLIDFSKGYDSPEQRKLCWFNALFPSAWVYFTLLNTSSKGGRAAKAGLYSGERWARDSQSVFNALEAVGVKLHVHGIENLMSVDGPCVIVGNHMSSLETMVLPGIIQPYKDSTFVIKDSLLQMPWLGNILRARDPIAVTRSNLREDMVTMLNGGLERLNKGRSIIIFPQSTRSVEISEKRFNSIGVKLARRAGVPVVPLALRTDAWSMNKITKDFGAIRPQLPVHFAFGQPIKIEGAGKEEHAAVLNFITTKLEEWGLPQARGSAPQDVEPTDIS